MSVPSANTSVTWDKPVFESECSSVMPGCKFVAHRESRDGALAAAIEHMHQVHEIEHLSDPLKARIRAAIFLACSLGCEGPFEGACCMDVLVVLGLILRHLC